MRGGFFAAGIILVAVAVMFALLPIFDGHNLRDRYTEYTSPVGEIARAASKEMRRNYTVYMTLIAIDIVIAIAGAGLMTYGAVAKKEKS
jgi:general stress protein CsbA